MYAPMYSFKYRSGNRIHWNSSEHLLCRGAIKYHDHVTLSFSSLLVRDNTCNYAVVPIYYTSRTSRDTHIYIQTYEHMHAEILAPTQTSTHLGIHIYTQAYTKAFTISRTSGHTYTYIQTYECLHAENLAPTQRSPHTSAHTLHIHIHADSQTILAVTMAIESLVRV